MMYTLDKIKEMAEGDDDFVRSIIEVFLSEVPIDLEALKRAISEKNFDQTYKLAHKIKPNVDLLGMQATRENALAIETLSKEKGNINEIEKRFAHLEADVIEVLAQLKHDFQM